MWRIFFQKKEKRKSKSAQKKKRENYVTKYSICAKKFPIKIRMIGIY
jgi:low temperature requirement protein LtrA